MVWALVLAPSLSLASPHWQPHPLYASYCAALLENQRASDVHERRAITATLDRFKTVVEERLRAEHAFVKQLGPLNEKGTYVHVWLEDQGRRGMMDRYALDWLRRVPERVAQIQKDIYSIQEGVVAGATEVRGQIEILTHLDRVKASVDRNEAELRPAFDEAHPYVTKKRIVLHSALIAVPTAAAGAVAWWTVPSVLDLDVSWGQGLILAASVPLGWLSRFGYSAAGSYWRGLFFERHRGEYEDIFGTNSTIDRFYRLTKLRELVEKTSAQREVLIHVVDKRVFSEAEMREIKAAVEGKRAPSLQFARANERTISGLSLQNMDNLAGPISYEMSTDLIYFFDREAGEPVLVITDRFERRLPTPTKRKRRPEEGARDWSFGSLKPAGS